MTRKEMVIKTMMVEVLAEDFDQAVEDALNCDHYCTGNCRRVGCNCDCGEWHIHDTIGSMEEKMETQSLEIAKENL